MNQSDLNRESVRSMVARFSQELDGVELVVKAVLDELGESPARLRDALTELLPDYCGTTIRTIRNAGRKPGKSAKVQGIRDWHDRFMTLQLHVQSGFRRIADCTAEDLMFAAGERRSQVKATMQVVGELERLQLAMKKHGAKIVSDLPAEVVRAAVEGQAAA